MTKSKLLLLPLALIFLVSLSAFVNAASVVTNLFYDSTTDRNATILYGEQIGLIISADSIFEDNMTVSVDLLDSNGDLIRNLLSVFTTSDSYSNYIILGPSIYNATGNYRIVSTVTAASEQTDTDELALTVNPATPGNNAPVITSIPITQVNESQVYVYDVEATDADNDVLTYSLTQAPSWLSINSQTGLVSGTAPDVSSNYDFAVTVQVSDGTDLTTQNYVLTVIDVPTVNNPPTVTVISPNGGELWSGTQNIMWNASDADGDILIINIWYSPDNGVTWTEIALGEENDGVFSWDTTLVEDGTYLVGIDAFDNSDFASDDSDGFFTINNSAPPRNNPPVITSTPVTSVNERANYNYDVNATDVDGDTLTYSMTGPSWLTINTNTGLVSGTAPAVNVNTNFNITVTVSDSQATTTQTYVLTVNDITSTTGRKRIGGGGTVVLPFDEFENQKYMDQFASRPGIEAEAPLPEQQRNPLLKALLIFIWAVVFLLLIVLAVMLVRRMGK